MGGTFQSGRGVATATVALAGVQMGLMAISLALVACVFGAPPTTHDGVLLVRGALSLLGGTTTMAWFAADVVFLIWVYRAVANLPALGSPTCRFTPGSAVGSFFIPFVNLVVPYQVLATIWTESQPGLVSDEGYLLRRPTTLVNFWWALYIVGCLIGGVMIALQDDLHSLLAAYVALYSVRITCGVLFVIMVRRADQRQHAQWEDLQRRAAVPQPTADALR
jgi:hypothetical protein